MEINHDQAERAERRLGKSLPPPRLFARSRRLFSWLFLRPESLFTGYATKTPLDVKARSVLFHESEPKYAPVPGRGYAPAKIFGGAKLVSTMATTEKISISLRPG